MNIANFHLATNPSAQLADLIPPLTPRPAPPDRSAALRDLRKTRLAEMYGTTTPEDAAEDQALWGLLEHHADYPDATLDLRAHGSALARIAAPRKPPTNLTANVHAEGMHEVVVILTASPVPVTGLALTACPEGIQDWVARFPDLRTLHLGFDRGVYIQAIDVGGLGIHDLILDGVETQAELHVTARRECDIRTLVEPGQVPPHRVTRFQGEWQQVVFNPNLNGKVKFATGGRDIQCSDLSLVMLRDWKLEELLYALDIPGEPFSSLRSPRSIARNLPGDSRETHFQLMSMGKKIHIVSIAKWNACLRHLFREMEKGRLTIRSMAVWTDTHFMAMRLEIRSRDGAPVWFVRFYEPEVTGTEFRHELLNETGQSPLRFHDMFPAGVTGRHFAAHQQFGFCPVVAMLDIPDPLNPRSALAASEAERNVCHRFLDLDRWHPDMVECALSGGFVKVLEKLERHLRDAKSVPGCAALLAAVNQFGTPGFASAMYYRHAAACAVFGRCLAIAGERKFITREELVLLLEARTQDGITAVKYVLTLHRNAVDLTKAFGAALALLSRAGLLDRADVVRLLGGDPGEDEFGLLHEIAALRPENIGLYGELLLDLGRNQALRPKDVVRLCDTGSPSGLPALLYAIRKSRPDILNALAAMLLSLCRGGLLSKNKIGKLVDVRWDGFPQSGHTAATSENGDKHRGKEAVRAYLQCLDLLHANGALGSLDYVALLTRAKVRPKRHG